MPSVGSWRLTIEDESGSKTAHGNARTLKAAFHAATDRPEVLLARLWDDHRQIYLTWRGTPTAPAG